MSIINLDLLKQSRESLKRSFSSSVQPHFVLDDFLKNNESTGDLVKEVYRNGLIDEMKLYSFLSTRSYESLGFDSLGDSSKKIINELTSPDFLKEIEYITGEKEIIADPTVATGGLVFIPKGSFGGLHLDDGAHPFRKDLVRKYTLLVYLNTDWSDENGGHLELWDYPNKKQTAKYLPKFGRFILFDCRDLIHSVATVKGENGKIRRAVTIWYYVPVKKAPFKPSRYYARPGSSLKEVVLIKFVNMAYISYLYLKRIFGFKDDLIVNLLKKLDYIFLNKKNGDRS